MDGTPLSIKLCASHFLCSLQEYDFYLGGGAGCIIFSELQRVTKQVVIGGTKKGLGIRIVGGRTIQLDFDDDDKRPFFGIFIKEIIKNSLAEKEGKNPAN